MTGQQAIHERPITFAEAAKLLRVSPRSVARYAFDRRRSRRLETVRIGSRYATTAAACARFIDAAQLVEAVPVDNGYEAKALAEALALCEGKRC